MPVEVDCSSAPAAPPPRAGRGDRWSRLWPWLLWLSIVSAIGLLQFAYHHLAVLAEGGSQSVLKPLINELTGALGAGLLFFAVRWLVRRFPLAAPRWPRRLPLYLGSMLLYAGVHTSFMWGSRELVYRLAGLGHYDYGLMPLRYAMELPAQVMVFWIMVGAIHGVSRLRQARERELKAAQLESGLARAQLANLRLQLQPHFLFNALNTISSTMYQDPAAADEMLDRLAELLRASLRTARTDEVPLVVELEILEAYLDIMRARFGDRLEVEIEAEEEAREALVPSMLLQPLVENAVRHGNAERQGRGRIRLEVVRRDGELVLSLEDDGPGMSAPGWDPSTQGLGLSATAERLQLLYGGAQSLQAGNLPGGGFRVVIRLPFRRRGEVAA